MTIMNGERTLSDYQHETMTTAIYKRQTAQGFLYTVLGLAGEAGELANKAKKIMRDNKIDKEALVLELGDVLWYVAAIADELRVNLNYVANKNLEKLENRAKRDKIKGSGDNR